MEKNGKLRKLYGRLSPFEKACVHMGNAFGRRKRSLSEAVAPSGLFESYWMTHWMHAIATVCGYAAFQALVSYFRARAGDEVRDVYGWIRALERLEKETGAPLTKGTKIFGLDICAVCREAVRETGEEKFMASVDIDFSENYAALREVWDPFTERVDNEDAWRKLPPVGAPAAEFRRVPAIRKTVRKRTEGVKTDRVEAQEEGDARKIVLGPEDVEDIVAMMDEAYREEAKAKGETLPPRPRREAPKRKAREESPPDSGEERRVPGADILDGRGDGGLAPGSPQAAPPAPEPESPPPPPAPEAPKKAKPKPVRAAPGMSDADIRRQLEMRSGLGRGFL